MIINELIPIKEQLKRIEDKLDGNYKNRFLSIREVSNLVSLSQSTIRRAVAITLVAPMHCCCKNNVGATVKYERGAKCAQRTKVKQSHWPWII